MFHIYIYIFINISFYIHIEQLDAVRYGKLQDEKEIKVSLIFNINEYKILILIFLKHIL